MSIRAATFRPAVGLLMTVLSFPLRAGAEDAPAYSLGDLTVRAEPGESRLPDSSTPATVLHAASLQDSGASHFQDVMAASPNFNWAGGTSRPRYFQVRGIGERSQFAGEGPPNFSVGFLVDDMDFSGLGMHASMFDVDTVEILRGPQAAVYGSKALAGLIDIHTRDPESVPDARGRVTVGTDHLTDVGAAAGGPLLQDSKTLTGRVSAESLREDGFRHNAYLRRDDTNARDELTTRAKLRWEPTPDWRWDLSTLWSAYDNGYDEFAPDNNGFTTYADRPGRDRQESAGGSLRGTWLGAPRYRVVSISSFVHTDLTYSYDADWGNDAFWAAAPYSWNPASEGSAYDYTETLNRTRDNASQDVRILSEPGGEILWDTSAWHIGAYASHLEENDDYAGFGELNSAYQADSAALYGQLSSRLTDTLVLRNSLRAEERRTDYHDQQGVTFTGRDMMWGGRTALERKLAEDAMVFASAARGFKGGGVNQNPALAPEKRAYDPETLWDFEAGTKATLFDGHTDAGLTLFTMVRDNLQIGTSSQSDPSDPTAFVYYTDNAAQGHNYGAELELTQRLTDAWTTFGSLGLLETEFRNYESADGGDRLDNRAQPHAPNYTFLAGTEMRFPCGYFARAEVEGKDAFYVSDSNDEQTDPYALLNLRAGYEREQWALTLWGRNVLDKKYVTRGYVFGLEPPNFDDRLYVAYGDPAQFGVTLDMWF